MNLGLKGKTALVTGSSQGIGKACALALAREGCNVILCARDMDKLKRTQKQISNLYPTVNVSYDHVDVTDRERIKYFISHIGALDILVNNAGGSSDKEVKLFDIPEEEWIHMFKLNTLSALWFTEFCVPLLERSSQPRVINIGTKASHEPGYTNAPYATAKSGLDYLNKRMSNELAPKGIPVNLIGPHMLTSETWERKLEQKAKDNNVSVDEARAMTLKEILKQIPMGRQGTTEDVANLVVFLASAQANFITGGYFPLDGGNSRYRY